MSRETRPYVRFADLGLPLPLKAKGYDVNIDGHLGIYHLDQRTIRDIQHLGVDTCRVVLQGNCPIYDGEYSFQTLAVMPGYI